MTREEIVALSERFMARIKRDGFSSRPITEAQKTRFDELKRNHEQGVLK